LHDVAGDESAIVHRLRVGHAADRGEPTGGGRAGAALDSLRMLETGLAQMNMNIDEARRYDKARGVEHLGLRMGKVLADGGDLAIHKQDARDLVHARGWVDHAAVPDQNRRAAHPMTLSSTAMRTAMPFSTWLRITERWQSATSLDSSRPRL